MSVVMKAINANIQLGFLKHNFKNPGDSCNTNGSRQKEKKMTKKEVVSHKD